MPRFFHFYVALDIRYFELSFYTLVKYNIVCIHIFSIFFESSESYFKILKI
jgi:hypothetical protein